MPVHSTMLFMSHYSAFVYLVCPPYLHILLGIVKLHHDLLETECHKLDLQIGERLALLPQEEEGNKTLFEVYVGKLQRRNKLKEIKSNTSKELEYENE